MPATAPSRDNRLREPLAAAFGRVPAPWRGITDAYFASDEGRALAAFIDRRVADGATVYPDRPLHALDYAPPAEVRVVILGQDPYHGAGQAQGLAFSVVAESRGWPPSLRNILREVGADIGTPSVSAGDLSTWAAQGVLLLNSALTVEDGAPQSHAGRGWESLTDALLAHVAAQAAPTAFLLWGAAAQRKRPLIERLGARHAVLEANHPSPLSANRRPRPFVGCRHFSQANAFLVSHRPGGGPIRW